MIQESSLSSLSLSLSTNESLWPAPAKLFYKTSEFKVLKSS